MKKILVIDDEPQMRDMLTQMLSREGYQVITADNGKDGLALFRQTHADLIVMDVLMPVQDGIQTMADFKKEFPNVPVIAMSGGRRALSPQFNLDSASMMGVRATLAKPFSRDQLLKTIKSVFEAEAKFSGTSS